jgi:SMODS domain-containing protein
VKLRGRKEFDLDFVCEFQVDPRVFPDPIKLLDMIEARLRGHGTYRTMVERKNRCIRVTYANEFYMDILPACPSPSVCLYGEHCLVVPDCDADDWKPSNPQGYALWYEGRAREAVVKLRKSVEPLPEQQDYEDLATLNRVVQLIKRRRDIFFEKAPKGRAPISIVLTTLAAQNYLGHTSVSEAMGVVLNGILRMIPDVAQGRLKVTNPTNPAEDLSERWDADPEAYLAFVSWIRGFRVEWEELMQQRGIHNVKAKLEKMFGERVTKEAVEEHIKAYESPRQTGGLGVGKGTGLIVPASSSATTIPRNTFYGGK